MSGSYELWHINNLILIKKVSRRPKAFYITTNDTGMTSQSRYRDGSKAKPNGLLKHT